MARPCNYRCVSKLPCCICFGPQGTKSTETLKLGIDELEAIRLLDVEKLDQKQASEAMKISQPTLSRLVSSAHEKLAKALVEGKTIKVEGGNYVLRK